MENRLWLVTGDIIKSGGFLREGMTLSETVSAKTAQEAEQMVMRMHVITDENVAGLRTKPYEQTENPDI